MRDHEFMKSNYSPSTIGIPTEGMVSVVLTTLIMTVIILMAILLSSHISGARSDPNTENSTRADDEEVILTYKKVTPGTGKDHTTFMFSITVIADKEPSEQLEVVLDGTPYTMKEVYEEDTDYSDGKDFYYSSTLDAGAIIYYFRCGNNTTPAYTLSVSENDRWGMHYDIALLLALFIIPFTLMVNMIKRIEAESNEWSRSLEKLGEKIGRRRN